METSNLSIHIRWYGELNDHLPLEQQYSHIVHHLERRITVGEFVSRFDIPVDSIDLVLVNGTSVDLEYFLNDRDTIAVFPVFESFDISSLEKIHEHPLRRPKFVLDVHLGKLANHLRMLGFDTLYRNDYTDDLLCQISLREHRTLLSKDRSLIETKSLTHAYFVKNKNPRLQLLEVLNRFQLLSLASPFTRCIECNTILQPIEMKQILFRLPAPVKEWCTEYQWCSVCDRIYWKGTHFKKMQEFILSLPKF
ncbi:MAG TPA: Mut7-C RNAse domain-containing protein [Bacteroidota bacterium]|nr:Mut7-C RNAse domain-containing protein [Bacteroidota bacterium]